MRGSTGNAPLKVLDDHALAAGSKRWRFASLSTRLHTASARPTALPAIDFSSDAHPDKPLHTSQSHFAIVLAAEAEANITASFKAFYKQVEPLSISMPLVFRNRKKLIHTCLQALQQATRHQAEATVSVANCLTAIFVDIGAQYLYPLFPRIISSFAHVFDNTVFSSSENNHASTPTSSPSILWDPSNSLIPLFASLAEITRLALQTLSAHPHQTVQSLLPLLSHPHYRIREMTAESCLGYLIRKTRDHQHLQRLTTSVVAAPISSQLDAEQQNFAANGLGTALFEAIRLPSGRLHSRAVAIITAALQQLLEHSRSVACVKLVDPCFSVLSTCFASLCRYVANEKDARAVTAIFVTCGERLLSDEPSPEALRVICLLRNWIHYGGNNISVLLGLPFLQRVLNFLSKSARKRVDDSRIIFESLSAMCSVCKYASSAFQQKMCRSTISPVLTKIAESGAPHSVRAALYAVLDVHREDWDFSRLMALQHGVGNLCDRIAQNDNKRDDGSPDEQRARVSIPALSSALSFINLHDRLSGSQSIDVVRLKCPTLEARILSLLRLGFEKDQYSTTRGFEDDMNMAIGLVLQYLSRVIVPGSVHLLCTAASQQNLGYEQKAMFLRATCFQSLKTESDVGEVLDSEVVKMVRSLISDVKETTAFSELLQALDFFFRVSPNNLNLKKELDHDDIEKLRVKLTENLSYPDQTVRILCAANLAHVCMVQSGTVRKADLLSGTADMEQSLALGLEQLQNAFQIGNSDVQGLFYVMRSVYETSQDMSVISVKRNFVQEIARLVQNSPKVEKELLRAVVQFSLGVLQTPLRLLWMDARSILRFAAGRDEELTMAIVTKQLMASKEDVLDYCRRRRSDRDEIVGAEDAGGDEVADTMQSTKDLNHSVGGGETNRNMKTESNRGSKKRKPALTPESFVKKRKRSAGGLIAKAWEQKSMTSDVLHERLRETFLFHAGSGEDEVSGCEVSTTDSPTVVVEVVKSLCEEPKHSMKWRVNIISVYLSLDPTLFSQKRGATVALAFTNLLEKLGGLKSCETDIALENRMRSRLLADLTVPNCELQAAVLRCLCVSRSPWIKPYRDSLIRLTQSKSFREELALITEGLFSSLENEQNNLDRKEKVVEVLTRICFSKLKGKWSNKDSQRSAVLSFLASKLPWDIVFPKLISLVLKPLAHVIAVLESDMNFDISTLTMPNLVVQKAVLGSVEAIVRQCRMSLPSSSWKQLTIATLIVMHNAGVGPPGQSIRSRSLRLFSEMHRIRPSETYFCTGRVMQTLKDAGFNTETNRTIQKTPALMQYVAAVMGSDAMNGKEEVIKDDSWSMEYCFGVMKGAEVDADTVDVALSVAKGFLKCCQGLSLRDSKLGPLLVPNVNRLLGLLSTALQILVLRLLDRVDNGQKARKTWTKTFAKSLEVLEMLAAFELMDTRMLVSVADALSTSLISGEWHASSTNVSLRALSAIAVRVEKGAGDESFAIQKSISRLIPQISRSRFTNDSLAFGALCDLLSITNLPDLVSACQLLKSMYAMKSTKLDSPDLDERIEALNELNIMIKKGLSDEDRIMQIKKSTRDAGKVVLSEEHVPCGPEALIALFCGAFAAIRSDDTAVRGNAGYAIALMAKWAAYSHCAGVKEFRRHIFESLVHATVTSKDDGCRREYCRGLGEFVRASNIGQGAEDDGLLILPIMKSLSSSADVNVDVFENLVHLQAHRRGRAIRDIEKCISSFRESLSGADEQLVSRYMAFVKSFCLPLALNMALELVANSDAQIRMHHMKGFQAKESSRRDVGLWAVSLAGESARLLDWENYKTCLGNILRRLRNETRDGVCNVLFKLLVKIAEAYPRYEEESDEYVRRSAYLADAVMPRMLQYVTVGAVEGDVVKDSNRQANHRSRPGAVAFQAPVAVAIAQLITQLPPARKDMLIPLLLTPMTNALRSRRTGIRDSAKKALTSVVLILGPKYLGYVLQQVLSGLTEGFRRDNCVFVIHSVLKGILDDNLKGTERYSLDSVYDIIADFLIEELKGGIDETKKEYEDPNASVSRQRQSTFRAMKACECAQIISESITFKEHAETFCKPYINLLANTSSSKLFHRIQEFWRHIIIGFSRNPSMILEDSFIFCYKLVDWETRGVISQATHKDSLQPHEDHAQQFTSSSYTYRISKLGLQFLSSILVKNWTRIVEKSSDSRKMQAMCEPFLPYIVKAMSYGRDDLTLVAFKVTQRMLKLPLPGRIEMGKSLSDTIVNVLSYGTNAISNTGVAETEDNLFIICLRSAAVLLSEVGTKDFTVVSRERVEALIAISCECIDSGGPEVRAAALSVLRSLVTGQVIIPKLYDAIEKVNHMAIHCQSRQLRDACTNLSVTFLVSFPLGSKRVRQNLEFFVRNLSYELAAGRLAALNAIHAVLNKFPGHVLERECEYLFVALASMVSRDVDADCRSNASQCLQLLFERLPDGRKVSDLLRMTVTLSGLSLSSEAGSHVEKKGGTVDPVIQRSGAVSLTAACMSGRLSTDQLGLVVRTAATVLPGLSDEDGWESIHSFLLCVEEAFARCSWKGKRSLEVQPYMFPVWQVLPSFLLSNHQWVRLSAARLLGRHLSSAGGRNIAIKSFPEHSLIWSSNDLVRDILRSCCLQLEANILAPALAKQILENLLCMADVLRTNPKMGDLRHPSARGSDHPEAISSEPESDLEEGRALNWLIARVSGIASKGKLESSDILRRGCALRFLLVSAKRWDRDTIYRHARHYTHPVMKILESGDIRFVSADTSETKVGVTQKVGDCGADGNNMNDSGITGEGLRVLAQTLQESLTEVIGTTEYFEVYSELRSKRADIKQSRKRNAALIAAADPERAAKKRRKKAESRRRQKMRKPIQPNMHNSAATQKQLLTEDL